MIPATNPIPAGADYTKWTPVAMNGEYLGPGVFRAAVSIRPSRVIDADGNTELHPDPDRRRQIVVENINAPAYVDEESPSLGAWWTAEVRAAVQAWAYYGVQAAEALGAARGVL